MAFKLQAGEDGNDRVIIDNEVHRVYYRRNTIDTTALQQQATPSTMLTSPYANTSSFDGFGRIMACGSGHVVAYTQAYVQSSPSRVGYFSIFTEKTGVSSGGDLVKHVFNHSQKRYDIKGITPETYLDHDASFNGNQTLAVGDGVICCGFPKSALKMPQNEGVGDTSNYTDVGHAILMSLSGDHIAYLQPDYQIGTNAWKFKSGTHFGCSIDIGHGLVVIGAPGHRATRTYHTGYNYPDDLKGAVYVYNIKGEFQFRLEAPRGKAPFFDRLIEFVDPEDFGYSVAIGDGVIAIGCPGITLFPDAMGNYQSGPGNNAAAFGGCVFLYDLQGRHFKTIGHPEALQQPGVDNNQVNHGFGSGRIKIANGRIYVGNGFCENSFYRPDNNKNAVRIFDMNGNPVGKIDDTLTTNMGSSGFWCNDYDADAERIVLGDYQYDGNEGAYYICDRDGTLMDVVPNPYNNTSDYFGAGIAVSNRGYAYMSRPGGFGQYGSVFHFDIGSRHLSADAVSDQIFASEWLLDSDARN